MVFAQTAMTTIERVSGKSMYQTTIGKNNDSIIIGKETDTYPILSPQIEIKRWNNEESLIFDLDEFQSKTPVVASEELKLEDTKEGLYFKRAGDDSFKIGLILSEIPSRTRLVTIDEVEYYQWAFKIRNWENYNFYYK